MIGMLQASTNRSPTSVEPAYLDLDEHTGSTSSPSPVATISGPLRLSGRRRQAIRPHAAECPADERKTTRVPGTGSSATDARG